MDGGQVTFYSRSRQCLWTKGETSGNVLTLDPSRWTVIRTACWCKPVPQGPTCHLGTDSCFDGQAPVVPELAFLAGLDRLLEQRERDRPEGSYTSDLFRSGTKRIAQKVGEEGVETALAAAAGDELELLNESADLLYHLLVLLRSRGLDLQGLVAQLASRHA